MPQKVTFLFDLACSVLLVLKIDMGVLLGMVDTVGSDDSTVVAA